MGLLTWILVGLVAGVIAQFVVGGGVGSLRGLVIAILLGVGGAVLGGFVSSAMGWGDVTGFNIRSLVIASLGAIAVVLVWQQLSKRNSR
ncbi:MAG: GlsB/YeaQ/YmgE family stress response membrane protein [Dehalococcoidia bacterium]